MSDIQYIGERLIFGKIGHLAIVFQFVTALISGIAFFWSTRKTEGSPDKFSLEKLGKNSFIAHTISVFFIIGLIFYLMTTQAYEYYYVWQHVSADLPMKYMLSAFWEGQEGSFLLWLFWHAILGLILLRTEKKYLAPVLGTLAFVQVILAMMLLGIHIGETRIGINPFVLLRDEIVAPIFASADYLSNITGSGLNPLLQNYWMTIHPPTLFLGFASVTIPFCYTIGGMYYSDHKGIMKAVLPWALMAAFFLGTGILMGGAWAYEALSFGGYWAWDPVENMSLVPWLILIAGVHTNYIARATGHSMRSTYVFYWIAFVFIIYSTFLTRSGILGDTSAHAFTEMGLEWQLVLFLGIFFFWGLFALIRNWKKIPAPTTEEKSMSREFWMYIGSLTLLFSGVLITFTTSIPVYNKLFDLLGYLTGQNFSSYHRTSPTDVIAHYNKYQLWIGIFIAFFSSIALFLRYKAPLSGFPLKKTLILSGTSVLLALIATLWSMNWFNAMAWQFKMFLFAGYLALFVNTIIFITQIKYNKKIIASACSHFGFGLLLLGILASGLNKQFISVNRFAQEGLLENETERGLGQNITLLKNVPMLMSGYEVTYTSDTIDGIYREFEVLFKKYGADGSFTDSFMVTPNILYDKGFSKVAASNPSTKRYLTKDIFTHIHSLPPEQVNMELAQEKEDSLQYQSFEMYLGDTVFLSDGLYGILEYIGSKTVHPEYESDTVQYLGSIQLQFGKLESDESHIGSPFILYEDGMLVNFPHQLNPFRLKIRLKDQNFMNLFYFTQNDNVELVDLSLNDKKAAWKQYKIELKEVKPDAKHPFYSPEINDLSLNTSLNVLDTITGITKIYLPAYVIRENKVVSYDYYDEEQELLVGINKIDPTTDLLQLKLSKKDISKIPIQVEIAEKSGRTDFIVLEAIVFPGINMVWAGSILMLIGFVLSFFLRYNAIKNSKNGSG